MSRFGPAGVPVAPEKRPVGTELGAWIGPVRDVTHTGAQRLAAEAAERAQQRSAALFTCWRGLRAGDSRETITEDLRALGLVPDPHARVRKHFGHAGAEGER